MESMKIIIFKKSAEFGILYASYMNQLGPVARKSVFMISEKSEIQKSLLSYRD